MGGPVTAIALLVALLLGAGCNREAKDRALAADWIARGCAKTGQRDLEAEIQKRGAALEPLFIEAFRNGPPASLQDEVIAAVEKHWSRLQIQISEPEVYGLSQEEIGEMRAVSLADEKREALWRLDQNYRSASLTALGTIGGKAGRNLLRAVAADRESPYRHVAGLAGRKAEAGR